MTSMQDIRDNITARLQDVDRELAELQRERSTLTEMLDTLDKTSSQSGNGSSRKARRPGRAPPAPGSRSRRRKRSSADGAGATASSSGRRAAQAIDVIGQHPGIAVKEIAEEMGIKPNYLYRVLPRLQNEGKISKKGTGYRIVPSDG
jgi:predicted Rossmann fold nucleotide-binding protein DprA/Smf involved in DNA uptake